MKAGWRKTTLGELATVQGGAGFPERYQGLRGQEIPFYKVSDMNLPGNEREMVHENNTISREVQKELRAGIFPKGSIIFPKIGGAIATNKKRLITRDSCVDNNVMGVIPKADGAISSELLFYFFLGVNLSDLANEGHLPSITKPAVEACPICIPTSLSEQRRIVGILDEAFAGLATAKANAEKNLQNARELFESHLESALARRDGRWTLRRLGDVVTRLTNGYVGPTRNIYLDSGVPYLLARHVKNNRLVFDGKTFISDEFNRKNKKSTLKAGDVLLVQSGHIGHSAVVTEEHEGHNCHAMIVLTPVADALTGPYLSLYFNSPEMRRSFEAIRSGSTVPHLTCGAVKELLIPLPGLVAQQRLVDDARELQAETHRLAQVYQQKLVALDALRSALLHAAFTGELGSRIPSADAALPPSSPVPFPATLPGLSTTDLHAGILAMACQLHERHGRLDQFTHVKAEKIAHMVEARLGIDLGRRPVKDAAGPNDFNHLKKVEHRARMTNAFDFKQVEGGAYKVHKLRGFDRLIAKTRAALGDRATDVDRLLAWMLPMRVRQAEIVATVFAAWNNLLLAGKQPTDEEIVVESREAWHPDKLKIERWRFFKAVRWLRDEGVIPQGKGKRVDHKG